MFYVYKKFLKMKTKSFYDLANLTHLNEAFEMKMKPFYDLVNLIYLYEAFKLETESFYDLANYYVCMRHSS